jgi:hypothetical protein
MTITFELLRAKEDRLMMRYEDDLSAYRRSNDNLLKKYKRSTSLLVSLQNDYDVLKNKVYVKKRPIDPSVDRDHSMASKNDYYDGIQSNHFEKQNNLNSDNKIINHNSTKISSGSNIYVMKKSKTMDSVAATDIYPIAAMPIHNDKIVRTSSNSNACPIVVWVDSQSSVSSYEENNHDKELHHHLIVKLLEKEDRSHIKSVSHDNRSNVAKKMNGVVDIDKDYIASKKPPINASYQRSVSMSSSLLDVGRYGGNHLNDLIGPKRRNPPPPLRDDDDDNIDMHREDKDEEDRIHDRKNDASTGRWNDKDDAFECDADKVINDKNPVRKLTVQRKEDKRIHGKDDDDRGRNKDQFQRLLDLRTMKTTSTNHINKLNKEDPKDVTMKKCIETVRGKENRAALPGHTCMECLKFYETMQQQGVYSNFSDSQMRRKVLQSCSRHKAKWSQPSTPEGFWDLSLGTPEDWK